MSDPRIPNPVAMIVGQVLGAYYYNHRSLDTLFMEKGAPDEPPEGNCQAKCTKWLKRASDNPDCDALSLLGGVLEEFMETDYTRNLSSLDELEKERKRVTEILARYGLSYHIGGRILGGKTGIPTRSLEAVLRARDLTALEIEFQRALTNVEADPATAVTAACAIVEALCKVYLEDEGLVLPNDQSIKPLWKSVQTHLGLDPAQIADDDLKRVLGGLTSIIDGLGAFRTHVGSAHGRGRQAYRPAARHARLALHAAHTLTTFVIETWDTRKQATTP
jgi:hypothetical protein